MPSTIRVGATTVAFTVTGTGPGLLVLHGAGASKDINWGFLPQQVTSRFTVIAPDLPGSGDTVDDGTPLDYPALIEQALAVVAAAGHERIHVLGYSLGAHLAAAVAAAHPERVLSLTAIAGWITPDAYMKLEFRLWQRLAAIGPETFAPFAVLTGSHPDWLAAADPAEVDATVAGFVPILAPGVGRQAEFITRTDLAGRLERVTATTLVVGLTADRQVPVEHARTLQRAIPGAQLKLLDAGHLAPWQAADELATAVAEFLLTLTLIEEEQR